MFSEQESAPTGRPPNRRVPVAQQAADLVWLNSGIRIRGAILGPSPEGSVEIMVRRAWLRRHARTLYEEATRDEAQSQRAALEQLRDRLRAWLQERDGPVTLVAFLERELKRVEERLADEDANDAAHEAPSQLLIVAVPKGHIRRLYVPPAVHRRMLLLAWQQHLPDPEEQSALSLRRALEPRKVDPDADTVDLDDRFPPRSIDERQWAVRVALVEYAFLAKPHFQGSGEMLVRADDGAPRPSIERLFAGILEDYVSNLIELGPARKRAKDASFKAALREAEQAGFRGVRITQIQPDLPSRVTVWSLFLARMPDGSWQLVWQQTQRTEAAEGRPDLEDRVRSDPQAQKVFATLKTLGLGADESLLEQAVRVGAATMEAESAASRSFQQFLSAAMGPLDAPLILTPDALVPRDWGQ